MSEIDEIYWKNILDDREHFDTKADAERFIRRCMKQAYSEAVVWAQQSNRHQAAASWPSPETTEEMGKRLRAARAYAGISQDELAERCEMSQPTLARMEKGERVGKWPEIDAIQKVTSVPKWWLNGTDGR